jgi:hypothetical protein
MTWNADQGTYLTGQEAIDTLDLVAIEMERKWGADRLRLLVPEDLRTKFDMQRKLLNIAIDCGELDDVLRETRRMRTAWRALDKAAEQNIDARPLPATVWEVPASDGSVIQLVRESELAGLLAAQETHSGRKVLVFTLEEVGRILEKFPSLYETKRVFPGCTITAVRQSVSDPWAGAPE